MPRNGSGVYSSAAGTAAVSGNPIESAKYNAMVADFVTDANTPRPIVAGGTGASSAGGARTAFGLEIGTDVQAYHAKLAAISGLTLANNKGFYATGANAFAAYDLTAAGRALLDDADAAAQRTTLGLGGAAVVDVIDEDDFATDSATRPPSQQSTKAYIESEFMRYRPGAGIFDGTGTPTWRWRRGLAASITKNATGDYSITFNDALPNTNYLVQLTHVRAAATGDERRFLAAYDLTVNGFRVIAQNINTVATDTDGISVTVHKQ